MNLRSLSDDSGYHTMGFYAPGLWTKEEMIAEVRRQYEDDYSFETAWHTQHIIRFIPVNKYMQRDVFYSHYMVYSEPGRGAFQASMLYLE